MRTILALGALVCLAGCGGNPSVPPTVSWGYGSGNGDPIAYPGAKPTYSFANGLDKDMPIPAGQMPQVSYNYGADGDTNVPVQMVPTPPQQVASPAGATAGTHS